MVLQPLPLIAIGQFRISTESAETLRHLFCRPTWNFKTIAAHQKHAGKSRTDSGKRCPLFKAGSDKANKPCSTFKIGLKPTQIQRTALHDQLRGTRLAYNWTLWLLTHKREELTKRAYEKKARKLLEGIRSDETNESDKEKLRNQLRHLKLAKFPSMMDLQDLVAKKEEPKEGGGGWIGPGAFSSDEDRDFYFSGRVGTQTKLMALKRCLSSYQMDRPERCRNIAVNACRSFGVQKLYVKHLPEAKTFSILPALLSRGRGTKRTVDGEIVPRSIKHSRCRVEIPPIENDLVVSLTPRNKFVLHIPCQRRYTRQRVGRTAADEVETAAPQRRIGIDPGVRTFATMYAPDEDAIYKVGTQKELEHKVGPLLAKADSLRSKMTSRKGNEARDVGNRIRRLNYRTGNIVENFHRHLVRTLVVNYATVVIGDHAASNRGGGRRRLARITNRLDRTWRHGEFKIRLANRAEGTDTRVHVQEESYTSKTCTRCGEINSKLGGNETFTCDRCQLVIDRDVQGAMNILKKFFYAIKVA